MVTRYLDFELEIGQDDGKDYPIAVLRSPAGEARARMRLGYDRQSLNDRLRSLQSALLWTDDGQFQRPSTEVQSVRAFGTELFNALFRDEVRSRFDVSLQQAADKNMGLRIKLRFQPPEIAALPWEYLYDPRQDEYLCLLRNSSLVRYIELAQAIQPLSVTPPLRILGIATSPYDLPQLDINEEKRRIDKATQELQKRGLVELVWLPGQSWQALQAALRKGPWHMLYYSGHGAFDERTQKGVLYLTEESGHSYAMSADQLGRLLSNHDQLRLVWLNSCEGARGDSLDIFSSTASMLVRRGIPAVVAMQYQITDRAAIELARAFYEAVADGFSVDAALSEARIAVSLALSDTVEWGTPVLYMRTGDGVLFDFGADEPTPRTKPAPNRRVKPATKPSAAIVQRSYARSDSTEFRAHVENMMRRASRLILIGTGLNVLQRDPFALEVMSRAAAGHCHLEVYLADPYSPAVETRLIEEELGDIKPPVGRLGLSQRLDTFLSIWKKLGQPDTIRIGLFTHYPTFALIVIDQDYFLYPYGYATLGNFSPVLHFSKDDPGDEDVIAFLDKQCELVRSSALDAERTLRIRFQHTQPADINSLRQFALYYVPPEDSPFYQFGTKVLGYDVRQGKLVKSSYGDQVGAASDFGFHLTLCDALYFSTETEILSIAAEIQFLAHEFQGFEITDFQIVDGFPDPKSIAIAVKDPTGSLEALHHELVHRVYRRAIASNYSLGLSALSRDTDFERARLMLKHYKAPYILQRFRPHFSLLTQVKPGQMQSVSDQLKRSFSEDDVPRSIQVDKLATMSKARPTEPWRIASEIRLG